MERLNTPSKQPTGILAFLSPKSEEAKQKEKNDREEAQAKRQAEQQKKRAELQAKGVARSDPERRPWRCDSFTNNKKNY